MVECVQVGLFQGDISSFNNFLEEQATIGNAYIHSEPVKGVGFYFAIRVDKDRQNIIQGEEE